MLQSGDELIHMAVGENQLDIVKNLIEKFHVDPTSASPLVRSIYYFQFYDLSMC